MTGRRRPAGPFGRPVIFIAYARRPNAAGRRAPPPTAAHFAWVAAGGFLLVVYASLLPFHFTPRSLENALAAFRGITFIDPADLAVRGDWVVSTALFATLSFLATGATAIDQSRPAAAGAAVVVAAGCFALSLSVEFAQLYFPPRTVSLNDVVAETAGGVAGAVAWVAGGTWVTARLRRTWGVTSLFGLAARLAPAYLAVLLAVELMPFDVVISPAELAAKAAEGKIRPVPFAGPWDVGATVETALNVAGFFGVGFLRAMGRRVADDKPRRWSSSVWPALVFPAVVEVLQLFVYSRNCDMTDVFTGMAGVLLGWLTGRVVVRAFHRAAGPTGLTNSQPVATARRTAMVWLSVVTWAGTVAYFNWQPFDFSADSARFGSISGDDFTLGSRPVALLPFVDYYWGSKYDALDQFVRKSFAFMLFGVLATFCRWNIYGRGAEVGVVAIALTLACALEVGRFFLPSRSVGVTGVLVAGLGAWIGFRLTRRVRALVWAETHLFGWSRAAAGPPVTP